MALSLGAAMNALPGMVYFLTVFAFQRRPSLSACHQDFHLRLALRAAVGYLRAAGGGGGDSIALWPKVSKCMTITRRNLHHPSTYALPASCPVNLS